MKLSKDFIIKANFISLSDARIRLSEFKKYKNLKPYSDKYPINDIKAIWSDANFFHIDGVEGLYGKLDDKLLFVFRGTDSLFDWALNFMFSKKVIPYEKNGINKKIRVHYGFFKSYMKVRSFIHDIVKKNEGNEIVFHGHSRGASIAALAALDVQFNFNEKSIGAFVIGMPRLGNDTFKKSFEKRLPDFTRIDYGSDLMPQIPPECFGYTHLNNFIHLGPERKKGIGTTKDHDGEKYMEALKNELKDKLYY